MITRIIKTTVDETKHDKFLSFIEPLNKEFKNIDGCVQFEAFREKEDTRTYFIYTIWKSESKLNKYRKTEFNKNFWKMLNEFSESNAQAWTVENIFEK